MYGLFIIPDLPDNGNCKKIMDHNLCWFRDYSAPAVGFHLSQSSEVSFRIGNWKLDPPRREFDLSVCII